MAAIQPLFSPFFYYAFGSYLAMLWAHSWFYAQGTPLVAQDTRVPKIEPESVWHVEGKHPTHCTSFLFFVEKKRGGGRER